MKNIRNYGEPPYNIAVVHGGPGASGEVAPIAQRLATAQGVLEPIQTATSIAGQVTELYSALKEHGDAPFTLIGHSWGAWLSFMVAAHYLTEIQKLILVSSGPFEARYTEGVDQLRASRLSEEENASFVFVERNKDEIWDRVATRQRSKCGESCYRSRASRLGCIFSGRWYVVR